MTDDSAGSDDPSSQRAAARIGQVVAGRYRLEALLGQGATGAVYRAAHPGGHSVAVKILDQELMASDVAQRFTRESELMQSIHHPHVVQTLASGKDDALGILYLVMPLLSGEDLAAVLQRLGALDPTAAVRIALQAARGIAAAHRLGVVHRDIKPGNLFLDTQADGRVFVRVGDFGIAKSATGGADTSLTRTGTQLGTPDYISPEQLKDSKNVDHRADVWGLGATLYEMLAGRPPFAHHERVFDVIAAIIGEEVPWLQDVAPWSDAALANVVHRMLRRNRDERYQTMDALIEALLPFSGGDGGIIRAQLIPVSPILRKVQKPRGEPPAKQRSAPRHAKPAASAAPETKSPVPKASQTRSPARTTPERDSPDAEQRPDKAPRSAPSQGARSHPETREKKKGGAGCWLVLWLLIALVAVGVVFWPQLSARVDENWPAFRPMIDSWLERLRARP